MHLIAAIETACLSVKNVRLLPNFSVQIGILFSVFMSARFSNVESFRHVYFSSARHGVFLQLRIVCCRFVWHVSKRVGMQISSSFYFFVVFLIKSTALPSAFIIFHPTAYFLLTFSFGSLFQFVLIFLPQSINFSSSKCKNSQKTMQKKQNTAKLLAVLLC